MASRFNRYEFARMLAKTAHAATVALIGRESFIPLLPEVIVGGSPFVSHLIGSPIGDTKLMLGVQDIRRSNLHEVGVGREQDLLIAYVALFARLGFHPYQVVVGRARI
jgi:hypothetical protein